MEKFTQKWAVIIPLENHADGSEFYYTDFPLHITIAGVFAIDNNSDQLVDLLRKTTAGIKQFELQADQEALFGDNKDIAVTKIRPTPDLINLHNAVHTKLLDRNAVFNAPHYQGSGYIPHSTYQKSGRLHPGDTVTATSVSLIDLFPNSDGLMRKIVKTIEFQKA